MAGDDLPAERPRDKEKENRKKKKKDKDKREGKSKTKTSRPRQLSGVEEDNSPQRADTDEQGGGGGGGFTQENILQLHALDDTSDEEDGGSGFSGRNNLMSSFFGTTPGGDATQENDGVVAKLYVENEISGEFFRVRQRGKASDNNSFCFSSPSSHAPLHRLRRRRRRRRGEENDGDDDDDDGSCSQWDAARLAIETEAVVVVMCNGIVVGLSWMDAFNLGVTDDHFLQDQATRKSFACMYSSVADRSRQLFFLLFNLSLLGLMRKISHLRLQRGATVEEDDALHHFRFNSMRLLQGAFVFTASALLVLIIASPSALRLATAYANNPDWCEDSANATPPPILLKALTRLQQSAVANAVLLSLGWLLVCIQCNLGMSSHLSIRRQLVGAHQTIDQAEKRVDHLEGKKLDELPIDALKDLIQLHKRAVEDTESMLVTKLQIQNPTNSHW